MQQLRTTIAAKATIAGLGLALAFAPVIPQPKMALAAEGSVTITQQHNEGATYDAYLVFKADISRDNKASHIFWPSDGMQSCVLEFIDAHGYRDWLEEHHPGSDQHDRPQNAMEFVSEMIAGSPTDEAAGTNPRTTQGSSFANKFARALASSEIAPDQKATTGEAFVGQQGYWLFCTTDPTNEAYSEAGSAPLWVPVGDEAKTILEKSAIPTVDKEVREDSDSTWGKVADACTDQMIDYRLSGTLPDNYGAFDFYHYRFTDKLSEGLDLALVDGAPADSVVVKVNGKDVPVDNEHVIVSYDEHTLSIDFPNLKDGWWNDFAIAHDTRITVEYTARMNATRLIGSPGNPNDVYLTYTDDPISNQDGRTAEVPVKVFAYGIEVTKVDEHTGEPLAGARFTMCVSQDNSDAPSKGLYVQEDGSLGQDPHEFETGRDGTFTVQGIDEGTYVISETQAPDGYDLIDEDVIATISSSLEGPSLKLANLSATVSGGDSVELGAAQETSVSEIDGNAGSIRITITDDKQMAMPLTGQDGVGLAAYAGVAAALLGGIRLLMRNGGSWR